MGVPIHQLQDIRAGPPHTCWWGCGHLRRHSAPHTWEENSQEPPRTGCKPSPDPNCTDGGLFSWVHSATPTCPHHRGLQAPRVPTSPWPPAAHTYH